MAMTLLPAPKRVRVKRRRFVLPLLQHLLQIKPGNISALILVPTRELALQIDQQIDAMSYYIDISSIAIYGGGSGTGWIQQKTALKQGADIIIATPGRLIAQLQMGGIDFGQLKYLILDEADRMLDMGFSDDIMKIVDMLPKERQTLCFSATMPPKIRTLTKRILNHPKEISIAISKPAAGVTQLAYLINDEEKNKLLLKILKEGDYKSSIIFCSSKDNVKKLERELRQIGIKAKAFHSDLEQPEREALMLDFKSRKLPILVGTDVLSRGIDVDGIELVLNYDVPPDPEDYVHRIGRTARAERTGTAITFISPRDQRRFSFIEKLLEKEVEKAALPEGFTSSQEYSPQSQRSFAPGKGGARSGAGGGRKPGGGGNRHSSGSHSKR